MSASPRSVAVVGAGLAGLRSCEALRARGYEGRLVLIGAERHLPYDRPPLSKQLLSGDWAPERCQLRGDAELDALGVEFRLGVSATRLDLGVRRLELSDGKTVDFDGLVIATGAAPRLLSGISGRPGVHTLRTIDDSISLREVITRPGARLVIAGAGFIGLEVAATARGHGTEVVVVEPLDVPLERAVGPLVGKTFEALHRDHGVDLRLGMTIEGVDTTGDGADAAGPAGRTAGPAGRTAGPAGHTTGGVRCHLGDGTSVEADALLVGIGAVPTVGWLEGSGLAVGPGGLACDEALVAGPGVVAAGDLARWPHPVTGEHLRVEHRTNAAEQGEHAAASLLLPKGERSGFAPVPYVWSDQYDRKIQLLGSVHPSDVTVVVDGSLEAERWVVAYERAGRLTGVLGCGRPRAVMAYRPLLERGASFADALALTRT